MKNLKKQRRIQVIAVATVALIAATGIIGYAMRDGINFFRSPTEVIAEPPAATETFRIGGLVEEGSLELGASNNVTFNVTDGNGVVAVTYTGILPDLFGEGEGMVGTGKYIDGVFQATEILARHDETYMPREVVDALKEQGHWDPASAAEEDAGY
ncbi:cytochrome c maturation protein CcmE [Primorskyibacter sp. S187A]|uniref:cytochrome c maturation protein CcmE n=1 Tax=Primorskyibacter sp. S187A TaxID=3415130 RepID=UPI003C79B0C8